MSAGSTRPLRFFNLFRLALVGVLLLMTQWALPAYRLPADWLQLWLLAFAIVSASLPLAQQYRQSTNRIVTGMLLADLLLIGLLLHHYGGVRSGFGMLLLPFLAVGGMLVSGRLALFHAAIATFVLFTATISTDSHLDSGELFQTAMLAIACFVTSTSTWLLGRQARLSEQLAARRGSEIARLHRLNALALQNLREAVIVSDSRGAIQQFNLAASQLLGTLQREQPHDILQPLLAEWRLAGSPLVARDIRCDWQGQPLCGRLVALASDEDVLLVLFLQPQSLLDEEARQTKLAALGRLTASMAHEIRNPLSAISHASELLLEESDNPYQHKLGRMVQDNTRRINRLVEEVLVLNRRDRVQPVWLHGSVVLEEILSDFAMAHPDWRHCLDWQLAGDCSLLFDRGHLQQIVCNLLANACRHGSGKAGSVFLSLADGKLLVRDDGPGPDKTVQQHLFEPFFTTANQGTGLGLYIARELALANGASLDYLPPGGCFQLLFGSAK